MGNLALALRGVGPESEAGSNIFLDWKLADRAFGVKCPADSGISLKGLQSPANHRSVACRIKGWR